MLDETIHGTGSKAKSHLITFQKGGEIRLSVVLDFIVLENVVVRLAGSRRSTIRPLRP